MIAVVVVVVLVVLVAALVVAGLVLARRAPRRPPEALPGEPPAPPAPVTTVEPPEVVAAPAPEVVAAPAPEVVAAPAPEVVAAPAPEAVAAPAAGVVEAPAAEVVERPRLRDRLGRTRSALTGWRRRRAVDDETWDELEEALLLADVGVPTTARLLESVKARAARDGVTDADALAGVLRDEVRALLDPAADRALHVDGTPSVWMFVGVNGVGKTTTIGKLASQQVADGRRVVLAAADTFRAAAADQLGLWAQRSGGEIVRAQEGADPGSVVFDAMAAASSRGAQLVLVDTAGRLHTKTNLMEELKKLRRIVERTEGALQEVLLVIDASTGQNGLAQARQFADAVDVTGIALTKLDGTAKGGVVLAIQAELGIPVKVVGVGEAVGDLVPFDPDEFASALFA